MQNAFRFSLLENGLDFLESSLDYLTAASANQSSNSKGVEPGPLHRQLKYALLHLCSSIELIFKERLRQEHWSLVFKDVSKANKDDYESGDFQSVTFQEAQDRLILICEIELTQKQQQDLKRLRDRRNKIEHFGVVESLPAIQASVSLMVSFLIDFVETAFEQDGLTEEEAMISAIRSKLGKCEAVVEQRWKEIRNDVAKQYSTFDCPTCQQKALNADSGSVKCLFCNYSTDSKTAANDYVSNILGFHSRYGTEKDGGDWPLRACPDCGNETLVTQAGDSQDAQDAYCFTCGQGYDASQLETCYHCGELYNAGEETGHHICSDCFRAAVAKDD